MEKHYGEILEKTIRRNGYSISALSRKMKVNRRSIYNWFKQPHFKQDIIFKIGCALKYDFSKEFPEFFSSDEFQKAFDYSPTQVVDLLSEERDEINYWKDKYINLLEEYNQILIMSRRYNASSFSN